MKISEVKYTRRFTTGKDFEFVEVVVTALPELGETADQVLEILKMQVEGEPKEAAGPTQQRQSVDVPNGHGVPALGAFVIPGGKLKGRTLASLGSDEIPKARGAIRFYREQCGNDGKTFPKSWEQYEEKLEAYVKTLRR